MKSKKNKAFQLGLKCHTLLPNVFHKDSAMYEYFLDQQIFLFHICFTIIKLQKLLDFQFDTHFKCFHPEQIWYRVILVLAYITYPRLIGPYILFHNP